LPESSRPTRSSFEEIIPESHEQQEARELFFSLLFYIAGTRDSILE
jgi:hypothetical protein